MAANKKQGRATSNVISLLSDSDEEESDSTFESDAALAAAMQQQLNEEANQQYAADAALAASLQQPSSSSSSSSSSSYSSSSSSSSFNQQQYAADAALAASLQHAPSPSTTTTTPSIHNIQIAEQPPRLTTGILQLITSYYNQKNISSVDKNSAIYISSATADHFNQVINPRSRGKKFNEPSKSDGYSCGYRSMQMICSSLLKINPLNARSKLFGGSSFVPDVEGMKKWLEIAWQNGWDPVGNAQIGPSIAGTDKWVGTTEGWALLSNFGISCRIVSFNNTRQSYGYSSKGGGSKGGGSKGGSSSPLPVAKQVEKWLWDYFEVDASSLHVEQNKKKRKNPWDQSASSASSSSSSSSSASSSSSSTTAKSSAQQRVRMSSKFPIYMQHSGHSRVIVGVSIRGTAKRPETQLLIFDPATYGPDLKNSMLQGKNWHSKLKRGLHTLKKPEYEFLVVQPHDTFDPSRSKFPTGA
jgi:hypothetical protein